MIVIEIQNHSAEDFADLYTDELKPQSGIEICDPAWTILILAQTYPKVSSSNQIRFKTICGELIREIPIIWSYVDPTNADCICLFYQASNLSVADIQILKEVTPLVNGITNARIEFFWSNLIPLTGNYLEYQSNTTEDDLRRSTINSTAIVQGNTLRSEQEQADVNQAHSENRSEKSIRILWTLNFGYWQDAFNLKRKRYRTNDIFTIKRDLILRKFILKKIKMPRRHGSKVLYHIKCESMLGLKNLTKITDSLHKAFVNKVLNDGKITDPSSIKIITGSDQTTLQADKSNDHIYIYPLISQINEIEGMVVWYPNKFSNRLRSFFTHQYSFLIENEIITAKPVSYKYFGENIPLIDPYTQTAGSARIWHTITPFVPPRHIKKNGKNTILGQIEEELKVVGISKGIKNITITPSKYNNIDIQRGNRVPAQFVRYDVEIEFTSPVEGPILIGYGAHFGLGLFGHSSDIQKVFGSIKTNKASYYCSNKKNAEATKSILCKLNHTIDNIVAEHLKENPQARPFRCPSLEDFCHIKKIKR